jgi:hypothetical protein
LGEENTLMAVDFPSSPTVGQTFTSGGVVWLWDGVKWTSTGAATGLYLPLAGGAMQGDLILNRDAQVALGAATLEQVQARGSGANRIINGDMRIDQRNGGAAGTAGGYTVDRWQYAASQAAKGTWGQSASGAPGFPYCLSFASSSAYTAAAAEYFEIVQAIEADAVSDFQWGTANAQPVTLSFWATSNRTGTFSGAIQNYAGTRAYPFSFSLPTVSTWTKIVITIPGDTGGAWVMSGNAGAAYLCFDLGSGSSKRGPANAWASVGYTGVTGAVSIVATNGATFYVTGVKLEVGSVATPYNRQSLAKSMADCQRYYQTGRLYMAGYQTVSGFFQTSVLLPVQMRAAPTLTPTTNSNANMSGFTLIASTTIGVINGGSATTVAPIIDCYFTASAEL